MNDDVLSHALSCLEGSIELVSRQLALRGGVQPDKSQRLTKLAQMIVACAKTAMDKTE